MKACNWVERRHSRRRESWKPFSVASKLHVYKNGSIRLWLRADDREDMLFVELTERECRELSAKLSYAASHAANHPGEVWHE